MLNIPTLPPRLILACALLSAASAALAAAPPAAPAAKPDAVGAGHATPVAGTAYIERGGERLPLVSQQEVRSGDSLVTSAQSNAQLNMADGAVFALEGNTTLRVDQYVPQQNEQDTAARSFYSLLRGGFRTVTGLIGKLGGQRYKVDTPMATIGVKGTEYLAVICRKSCFDPNDNTALPDGLYTAVIHGVVTMVNPKGGISIAAGQTGFAESINTRPIVLNKTPAFLIRAGAELKFTQFELDIQVHPPRIEPMPIPPEPPGSPS